MDEADRSLRRTRVVMVDDQRAYLQGMSHVINELADDFEVVGTTAALKEVAKLVRENSAEMVLLDIRMPKREGLDIARELRQEFPDLKLVICSVSDLPEDAYEAMHLGAVGYIDKVADVDEILAALRLIRSGRSVMAPFVVQTLLSHRPGAELSQGEINLLKLVGEGFDNAHIAERLSMSRSTVKRNLQSIMKRLNVGSRTEAAADAARRGLI